MVSCLTLILETMVISRVADPGILIRGFKELNMRPKVTLELPLPLQWKLLISRGFKTLHTHEKIIFCPIYTDSIEPLSLAVTRQYKEPYN